MRFSTLFPFAVLWLHAVGHAENAHFSIWQAKNNEQFVGISSGSQNPHINGIRRGNTKDHPGFEARLGDLSEVCQRALKGDTIAVPNAFRPVDVDRQTHTKIDEWEIDKENICSLTGAYVQGIVWWETQNILKSNERVRNFERKLERRTKELRRDVENGYLPGWQAGLVYLQEKFGDQMNFQAGSFGKVTPEMLQQATHGASLVILRCSYSDKINKRSTYAYVPIVECDGKTISLLYRGHNIEADIKSALNERGQTYYTFEITNKPTLPEKILNHDPGFGLGTPSDRGRITSPVLYVISPYPYAEGVTYAPSPSKAELLKPSNISSDVEQPKPVDDISNASNSLLFSPNYEQRLSHSRTWTRKSDGKKVTGKINEISDAKVMITGPRGVFDVPLATLSDTDVLAAHFWNGDHGQIRTIDQGQLKYQLATKGGGSADILITFRQDRYRIDIGTTRYFGQVGEQRYAIKQQNHTLSSRIRNTKPLTPAIKDDRDRRKFRKALITMKPVAKSPWPSRRLTHFGSDLVNHNSFRVASLNLRYAHLNCPVINEALVTTLEILDNQSGRDGVQVPTPHFLKLLQQMQAVPTHIGFRDSPARAKFAKTAQRQHAFHLVSATLSKIKADAVIAH